MPMLLEKKKILFALTDAFYAYQKTIPEILHLIKEGAEITPIMSNNAYNVDSKFGKAKKFVEEIEKITGKKIIHTIEETQKIFDEEFDIMVIAPCSREHNRKTSKWDYRYTCFIIIKNIFKRRK